MTLRLTPSYLQELASRIQRLYRADSVPWIVGYSGGKDSTATLQLVWRAVQALPMQERHKPVHVISTDTLVEQPLVATWVKQSLDLIERSAGLQDMPVRAHRLTPSVQSSFWVNLIGRGYAAPRATFRWCTSRLKIEPSNRFITDMAASHGESILVLGTRKAESSVRAANMTAYEQKRTRDWLSPNGSLPNSFVFTPIEDWTSDEVWFYLLQYSNPWGLHNKDLLTMYRGASPDNECPLVIDTSTPSCGQSRFGCWVCTVVAADKSMEAMIQNDEEKSWLSPLLEFRNELGRLDSRGVIDDWDKRDFRRLSGEVFFDTRLKKIIRGPYTRLWREHWLRRLLSVEQEVRRLAPSTMKEIRLISDAELREIRRVWVLEKHEWEDSLPGIYEAVVALPYPWRDDLPPGPFGREEWSLLRSLCGSDESLFSIASRQLGLAMQRIHAIHNPYFVKQVEDTMTWGLFSSEEDAHAVESARRAQVEEMEKALQLDFEGYLIHVEELRDAFEVPRPT